MKKYLLLPVAAFLILHPAVLFSQLELTENLIRKEFGGACSLAAADFNNDGYFDFAITASDSGHVGWFENDGTQQFIRHMITEDFPGARALDIADFDGDNDMDVVATAYNANRISWFENDGSGNFTEHILVDNWTGASYVFTRDHLEGIDLDMDGDGDTDVLATACGGDIISWFENDGNQNFTEHILKDNWDKANYATATDLDEDGDMDVIATAKAGQIVWFENDGFMTFTEHEIFTGWAGPNSVMATDIDGDGDVDFAATACGSDDKVAWFQNDGNENFTYHLIRENYNGARTVNMADFSNDGDIDILAIAWQGAIASIFENDGAQNFTEYIFCDAAFDLLKTDILDIDFDGDLDIIGACFGADEIRWWENEQYGARFEGTPLSGHIPLQVSFTDNSVFPFPIVYRAWDFDHDGIVDSNEENPSWIFENPGKYTVSLEVRTDSLSRMVVYEDYIAVFDGESALEFNGSGSFAWCEATPELDLCGPFSLEAWINPATYGAAPGMGMGRIFDKGRFMIYLIASLSPFNDSCLVLEMEHNSKATSRICTPAGSIKTGQWQHIAVTYDAAGLVTMYINGEAQTLTIINPPNGPVIHNADKQLIIGKSATMPYSSFNGIIDEARVWESIRSQEEVETHMDHYLIGNESGLLGYWKFNEGAGPEAVDLTGHGNNCTRNGAQWCQGKHLDNPVSIYDNDGSGLNILDLQVFPNPFDSGAEIQFHLNQTSYLHVAVFDVHGRLVRNLTEGIHHAGSQQIFWDGSTTRGKNAAPGIYICRIHAGNAHGEIKMVKVR
ncbi:MAG: VCBS repeat-containing protein [Bacteroidetes bacterium]|nr:VCBS repeat-containing protein [Bacteroidota bacterium]